MTMRWYIVHAYSNFERKVADSIKERAAGAGLADQFAEVLVPMEEVVEMRRGRKVASERKFFPGYVLVKMELNDETYHLIKATPKVTGFLGTENKPIPITEEEAGRILQQVQEGVERPKPSVTFEIGEQVRVADGPSPRSTVSSRRSTRSGRGSRWRCPSSGARRRSSSNMGRWRSFEARGFQRDDSQEE